MTTTLAPRPASRPARTASRRLAVGAATASLAAGALVTLAAPAGAVTQASAEASFRSVGITWSSSGGCSDPSNGTCTAFEGLRSDTVNGAMTLRTASGCAVNVTGGTETGHSTSGTKTHANGWKLDFSLGGCLDSYVKNTFTRTGTRSDGAALWTSASGNVYALEGNHWDVVFNSCGGCRVS